MTDRTARRLIAAALLIVLIAIIAVGFGTLFWIEAAAGRALLAAARAHGDVETVARLAADQSKADGERLALILNIVFGPVVTLIGSVTGYYFGTQNRK